MASGSVTASKSECLMCSLCLEIFTSPKLLPCHHTFCEQCLKDLVARHPSGRFPCPSCRKETKVPSGGVSAFQTNFYIDPEDLERARDSSHCLIHLAKELEFFCIKCDQAICLNCKLTEHEMHETKDLVKYAVTAKIQLLKDSRRLAGYLKKANDGIVLTQKEKKETENKRSVLEIAIHNRHATLQAAIDKYRDQALASLDEVTGNILSVQKAKLLRQQDNFHELAKLEERLQQALDKGAASELVTVAREMRDGRCSENAMQKLMTQPITTVYRPVLRFSTTPDDVLQFTFDYIGCAAKMEMSLSEPEVIVMEQFRCREDPDTDVCNLCPMTDGHIWVTFEPHMLQKDHPVYRFDADGHLEYAEKNTTPGRRTIVRRNNGYAIQVDDISLLSYKALFAKRCDFAMSVYYQLQIDRLSKPTVMLVSVVSKDPFKTITDGVFQLNCSSYRAFDVDKSEELFVVLQETKTPHVQRRVQLYQCPEPDAIATYVPPVTPFQPSDVCFYTLGGQEVLLVADELNDAIHVVKVQDGRLSFLRYLAPGCPLLVQPTALNTDTKGRLWVACRGGRILTCTPIS